MNAEKAERPQNPRSNANIFKILTFGWMLNLFKAGRKRELEVNDLYSTLSYHTSSSLGNALEKKWRSELINAYSSNRKPSLLRVLIQMFGAKYMFYGFCHFIDIMILKMCQPLLIGGLLSYFNIEKSTKTDLRYAYICAFGLVLSMLTSTVLFHSTQIEILHCGMKIRVACCSAIYRKALRLSYSALSETTVGQVINLLSNDVNRFDVALHSLHFLWIGPLQTIAVTYFVWQEIGVSSLFGVATLFLFLPLQGWLGKQLSVLRLKTAKITDERVCLMNEIISGIHVIKMYTWERMFGNLIAFIRKKEIHQITRSLYIKAISGFFPVIQSRFQLFISILTYVLLGNYISIRKVFVITSFYNILVATMSRFFFGGLEQLAELLVTVKRIQIFLLHGEKCSKKLNIPTSLKAVTNDLKELIYFRNIDNISKKNTEGINNFSIIFSNVTAKWTTSETFNCLTRINLNVKPNELVVVVGPVGAGKSSLLQAILGELPLSEGTVSINGKVSYTSQEPWLFAGSIQQNILFDSPMDKDRYRQVLKVCALKSDIEKFPYGDRTIIGERGITLSGGQKARINLARAIYKQADIYLLDDPLSAVDTKVGIHLFEKCIKGYLKEKTCVLVTHQVQCLSNIQHIVLMKNACVVAQGSFQELQISSFDFKKLLGSPGEISIVSETEANNKNYNGFVSDTVLSSLGSNESISLSIDESEFSEELAEPHEVVESTSGHITKDVYISYISAGGSIIKIIFFIFMYIITQVLVTGGDYWISYWVNQEEYVFGNENNISTSTLTSLKYDLFDTFTMTSNCHQTGIKVYAILIVSLMVTIFIRSAIFVSFCMSASKTLHNRMCNALIRATMFFFNMNSSGSIFNHFSKDMGAIDEILPLILLECFQILLLLLGIFVVVGVVNVYLMIPTFIMGVIFYYIRGFYLPTSRSMKRIEGVTRSPVFTHLNTSIQGLTTIRAHQAEHILSKEFDSYQDLHSTAWYLCITSNEAFGCWLNTVCTIYISIVIFSFLAFGNNIYGGNVGLVITQVVRLTGMFQWGIRQSAVLENQMTSVERVLKYTSLPQEATLQSSPDKIPPKEWPNKGQIIFQNFYLRYGPNASYVLKNINIVIQPMEKIGIVGRTGAGKSSIVEALFRFAFNKGNIIIDNIEIHELGLHDLRSKFSIIPQQPVLFSGTMRTNLDPFDEYPDHVLWNSLDEVELKVVIENLPEGLNSKISENGSNFSVGQRQLVCLARALVRKNKILVLDEATANVDSQTDVLIQNTIRNKFNMCTVLTIAHRLNTVMDSDKILVMDDGNVVEFDHPYTLLKNENGYLFKMVEQTGHDTADLLHSIAEQSIKSKQFK